VRFRPARVAAGDLAAAAACRFRCDGAALGPLRLLNLSAGGFAASAPDGPGLPLGTLLGDVEILLGDRVVWSGAARVVRDEPGCVGARFESAPLDLGRMRLEATVQARLDVWRAQRDRLPSEWRAAVSDVQRLLEDARQEVEAFERCGYDEPLHRVEREAELFDGLRARWGQAFYEALASLHEQSASFDEVTRALGRSYAQSALMPLLRACPMHRRAYEKPLGYAGDYRTMELHFARDRTGDGMFGRFLHAITQSYTLCRAVVAREKIMRDAVHDVLACGAGAPARVLALAAGPAIELRHVLANPPPITRPLELILLDQDESAHETAHGHLMRLLVERHRRTLPITLTCLHFSVRQLLAPQSPEERHVASRTVADLDLVYSAGLYDYLSDRIAARLSRLMYSRLRAGGRLLMGNLVAAPDTTWMMEYVLGWELRYRTEDSMLALATGLSPVPASVRITRDETGHCIFLDVARP
jgi:extracellular factor (EF) 3-hydroxypalmitic acid methyl ester biosynthesis protein